jgi:hypothetical protein
MHAIVHKPTITPWYRMLLSESMFLRCVLFSVIPVSAESASFFGDIPESFIWFLSFAMLVGCAIVSMMSYPMSISLLPPPGCPTREPQTVFVKIDPKDLKEYASILHHS